METRRQNEALKKEEIQKILRECEQELTELSLIKEDDFFAGLTQDFKTRIFQFLWVKLVHAVGEKNNTVPVSDIYAGMPQPALEALQDLCNPRTNHEEEKKEIASILKSWEGDCNESK